jgi:hypothetical protein
MLPFREFRWRDEPREVASQRVVPKEWRRGEAGTPKLQVQGYPASLKLPCSLGKSSSFFPSTPSSRLVVLQLTSSGESLFNCNTRFPLLSTYRLRGIENEPNTLTEIPKSSAELEK